MLAVAQCLPLWQHHWFNSHEGYSYVMRVVEFEAALRHGDFYPRWASDFYGGYGAPFFVFYAPLSFAGGAVFSAVFGSAVAGLKAWLTLASIVAGLGAYAVVKAETRRPDAALLAALLFLAAPYRLTNIYVRGDIAEYTALAFLPWAVWGYRGIAQALPLELAPRRAVAAVLLHAALLFSHAIMAMWCTMLLAVVVLVTGYQASRRGAPRQLWLLGTAFTLALAVASVYLGPALIQKSYVKIDVALGGANEPVNQLLRLSALFGVGQFGVGGYVAAALALALAAALFRRSPTALGWGLGAALCVLMSTRYAEGFWDLKLPLTRFIQFPWRLHGLAALGVAFSLGLAWAALVRGSSWREASVLVLGACAALASAPLCAVTNPLERGSFPDTTLEIRKGVYHTTAGEYLPSVVSAPPRYAATALVGATTGVVTVERTLSVGSVHELSLRAGGASTIELNLHMFPGWAVETLSGPAGTTIATSPTGLVSLKLPSAGQYRLRVSFGASPLRALFGGMSVLALFGAWPLLRALSRSRPLVRGALPRLAPVSLPEAA